MTCSICGEIATSKTVNTGRDEYFREPLTTLKPWNLGREDDLWECPECRSVFHFNDYSAWTGSGNNDDQTLTRLPPRVADAACTVFHRAKVAPPDLADLARRVLEVPVGKPRELLWRLVRAHHTLVRALLPHLLDEAARDPAAIEMLLSLVTTPDEAAVVGAELARRPELPHLVSLRRHARVVGCSVCRHIPVYPPLQGSRERFAAFRWIVGSAQHDVLECPECTTLCEWTSKDGTTGGVTRVYSELADVLRECIARTSATAPDVLAKLARYGAAWQDLARRIVRKGAG